MNQQKSNKTLVNWDLVTVNPSNKNWNWKDLFCFWGVGIQSVIGFSLIASLYVVYDLNTFVVFFGTIFASLLVYFFSNLIGKPSQKSFEGIVAIFKNKSIYMIMFLSLFIWSIYFYIGLLVLDACKISLEYIEVGVLTVISSLIIGIPSLPGAAGTLHSGIRYTLEGIFQISAPKALSYAIISHAISYFPLLIIGKIL